MSVWAIPKIKTANGRGRAFVKFALIEKKLDLYLLVRWGARSCNED